MFKRQPIKSSLGLAVATTIVTVALAACASGTPTQTPAEQVTTPTPQSAGATLPPQPMAAPPTITLPADLALSGRLIFTESQLGVGELDFATGDVTSVYRPPEGAFVTTALLSPDGGTLLLSYSPPPDPTNPQYVPSSIYTLPADGSGEPVRLLADDGSDNFEFAPWWSPDGQAIYYGQYVYPPLAGTPEAGPTGYVLNRAVLPAGSGQNLLSGVLAAQTPADGGGLFYISIDAETLLSNIYAADLDGSNARSLLPDDESWIIDSLAVSPDGQQIVFNRGVDSTASLSWLDQMMGVQVARAHSLPSDLWVLPVGGVPEQITDLGEDGFVQAYSPDGEFIVFSCSRGVFVVRPDGSDLFEITSDTSFDSVQWLP